MTQKFSNAARAELAANINDTDTTISIVDGGGLFPVADTGVSAIGPSADWFKLVLQADDGFEIVYARTHTSGSNTFSDVLRGQDGTTARSFSTTPIPAVVGLRPTAADHESFREDIDSKAPINSPTFTGTVGGITKAMVGLDNVDNTADADKPISTATQTALEAKAPVESPTFTGAVEVPTWTTATRPTTGGGENNYLGFNTDTDEFEGWNGVEWASVGGSKIEVEDTTDAEYFPLFVDATTGTAKVVNVDDQNLTYNPATKRLSAPLPTATNGVFISSATITGDVVIGAGERGLSIDAELADGASLTIEDGGVYVVL